MSKTIAIFFIIIFSVAAQGAEEIKLFGVSIDISELAFKEQFPLAKCVREINEPKHVRELEPDLKVVTALEKKYFGKSVLAVAGAQVPVNMCEFFPNNEKVNPAYAAFYNGVVVQISRAFLPDEAIVVPKLLVLTAEMAKRTGVQPKLQKTGFENTIHAYEMGSKGRIEIESRPKTKVKGLEVPERVLRVSFSSLVLEKIYKQKWKEFLDKEANETGTGGA